MATKTQRIGTCALCLHQGVALRDSHIISQWVYRNLRDTSGKSKNPNPVIVQRGRATPSSRQEKEVLLCDRCEQQFSARERYVAPFAAKGVAPSPLVSVVQAAGTWTAVKNEPVGFAELVGYDAEKIGYFDVTDVPGPMSPM